MKSNIENLKAILKKMQKDGFDISKPLKWVFFFFDSEKKKLLKVYEELKDYNYMKESLEKMEDGKWRLYVTKIEILEVEKLYKRNIAFNELAEYCEVKLYDGWDVEKYISRV